MKTKLFFRGLILGIIVTSLFTNNLSAQYSTGIGLRIGGTTGLDVKHFYKSSKAFEGIIGTFGNGISFTGLIEKYSPIYDAPGLYFYYGGGAHLAFYDGRGEYYSRFGREINYYKNNDVGLGINGIVGLEYRLPDGIPISFSLDLKPFIELGTGGYVAFAPDPSLGIKFIIR